MASIDTGSGGGRKQVSGEVPLVPFIDLLLCCVMFLLVTAVWNQLARLETSTAGAAPSADAPPAERARWTLQVRADGLALGSSAGETLELRSVAGRPDPSALRARLEDLHRLDPSLVGLSVEAEDGVPYATVIEILDQVIAAGFPRFTLGATALR